MSLLDAKPHTISIRRDTFARVTGSMGEEKRTAATHATGIGCWVQAATPSEVLEFARRDVRVTHKAFMDMADEVRFAAGDRIVVTAGPTFVNDVLLVKAFGERSAGLDYLGIVYAEEERTA